MVASVCLNFSMLTSNRLFGMAVAAILSIATLPISVKAQITPDNTLGSENSMVTPDAIVRGDLADLIEGGAERGGNLFHSFLEFNVDEGQRVYFTNPEGVKSILSRVTGGDLSNIFGVLGVDGAADLFLLNPNGIVFGENAALDIAGSFHATTADAIELGDEVFSATEPEQSRLLTVSPSVLFENYLSTASGDIENRGQIVAEENLTLAANRLDLQGQIAAGGDLTLLATDEVQIRDTAEIPFVTFAGRNLLVQGNERVDIVALNHPDSGLYSYGDMVLRSANPVGGDAHYWSGGSFQIEQSNGNLGDLYSPHDPIIRSLGDVSFGSYFGASLHILAGGSVTIPGIVLISGPDETDFVAEKIFLSNGEDILVDGDIHPTLDIRAGVEPSRISPHQEIIGSSGLFLDSPLSNLEVPLISTFATSSAITIRAIGMMGANANNGIIFLTNQYEPNQSLPSGNIEIDAIRTDDDFGGFSGNSGLVIIDSRNNILITNRINSSSISSNAGNITLIAKDSILLSGSLVSASALVGEGGDISLQSDSILVRDGGQLSSVTRGNGDAGNIVITAHNILTFDGERADGNNSGAFSSVQSTATGQGGNIEISAGTLLITNGAQLQTSTFGDGDAGNVIISARDAVFLDEEGKDGFPSGIFSTVEPTATGQGGNVEISTGFLFVTNDAVLASLTRGDEDSGNVIISARNNVHFGAEGADSFPGGAFSSVEPGGMGAGGDVRITAANLIVTDGAQLNAGVLGSGEAGSVIIEVTETARFDGVNRLIGAPSGAFSRIALDGEGIGGDVRITATNLEITNGAQLSTDTFGKGNAGSVIIEVMETARFDGVDSLIDTPSAAFSSVRPTGEGEGGDVHITATNLELTNGASLSAATAGFGNAGNLTLNIHEKLLADDATIETSATSASGGMIIIDASDILLEGDSNIQTFVDSGEGRGGDIIITADSVIAFDDSDILAFARDGRGGNITLNSPSFFGENFDPVLSDVPSEDLDMLDGNDRVDINATGRIASGIITIPDVSFIENSLNELSGNLVNTAALTVGSCIARSDNTESSFIVTGGEGLPQQPSGSAISAYPTSSIQNISESTTTQTIQEPEGVFQLADGRIVLSQECD